MSLASHDVVSGLRDALVRNSSELGSSFFGWKITANLELAYQTLMLGDSALGLKPYQQRDVEDLGFKVRVYARNGEFQGIGNVDIDPQQPFDSQIKQAYDNAMLAKNEKWELAHPGNIPYEDVQTSDPKLSENIAGEHKKLQQQVADKAKTVSQVQINSAELFSNLNKQYIETSTGIKAAKQTSDIYFEIALEKLPLPNTQEVLKYQKAVSIDEADLVGFIDETINETLDIAETEVPQSQENACVLIDKYAISSLLDAIGHQLDANAEYQKGPHMVVGDAINSKAVHAGSDQLTLTLDPTLPVMANSTPYTEEGLPALKGLVIENNQIKHQYVNSRMASYLKRPIDTVCGNMVITLGNKSKEQLLADSEQCIEIITFSSLLVSSATLTWSSEIKLGKVYKNGKLTGMVKGGIVSGNIRENFSHFQFSNKSTVLNSIAGVFDPAIGYVGPDAMLIKAGVKIAGQ